MNERRSLGESTGTYEGGVGNPIPDFQAAMAAAGIIVHEPIIADGTLHRYHADGDRRGTKNAWATLHIDKSPAGVFGDHRRFGSKKFTWSAQKSHPVSSTERLAFSLAVQARRQAREEVQRKSRAAAAMDANRLWDSAAPVTEHEYLIQKRISGDGLRVAEWVKKSVNAVTGSITELHIPNALLIPIRNSQRQIVSLQAIFPDDKNALRRQKDFLTGGEKRGCAFMIGKPSQVGATTVIVVCEGYATGSSINTATGLCVVVAFDMGNLEPVSQAVRKAIPLAALIIAADNDRRTLVPIENPGVTFARRAAEAVHGVVAIPEFVDIESHGTDFNDLATAEGSDVVRSQIMAAVIRPVGS